MPPPVPSTIFQPGYSGLPAASTGPLSPDCEGVAGAVGGTGVPGAAGCSGSRGGELNRLLKAGTADSAADVPSAVRPRLLFAIRSGRLSHVAAAGAAAAAVAGAAHEGSAAP